MTSVPVFCGKDCGGNACPLMAEVEDGRVTRVYNNPAAGPTLKGCRRGFSLPQAHYASDRILKPLIRSGRRGSGCFREASWEEALQLTANTLGEVRAKYGARTVLNLSSSGSTGALQDTKALLDRFLNLSGGSTIQSNNYSNAAARTVLPYLFGSHWTESGWDAATLEYSEMIILWGANVLEARLGTELPQRLVQARKKGKSIVVIDPRRSATVKQLASWHIACRPGSDAALMLAVLYVLFSENLVDRGFIEAHSTGLDRLEGYVLGLDGGPPRTPEWAEAICGVPAQEITRFGRAYAAAKPAMLLPGYSIQRVYAGEETYRLTVALQLATGNFGKKGGSTGSLNNRLPAPRVGRLPVPQPEEQAVVPILRWADAVLEGPAGGYPTEIHAIYNLGSNYINQGGDVKKSIAAFEKVDFAVAHELFLTPTARYCDVIFPAASPLEKEDIGIPWLGNFLVYKPAVVERRGQARSDYEILCELASRLGFLEAFSENRCASEWVQLFLDQSEVPDQEAFKQTGLYLAAEQERVGLADFCSDPTAFPLDTPSGKVEIASERYQQEMGFPSIPTWQPPAADERYPLRLVTPKSPVRTHSQGSNLPDIQKSANHALEMNPSDAAERSIASGDMVRIFNQCGESRVVARVTEDLIPGVLCLPEGVWVELDEGGIDRSGSANLLTSTEGTRPGKCCIMHAVGVQVERCA